MADITGRVRWLVLSIVKLCKIAVADVPSTEPATTTTKKKVEEEDPDMAELAAWAS